MGGTSGGALKDYYTQSVLKVIVYLSFWSSGPSSGLSRLIGEQTGKKSTESKAECLCAFTLTFKVAKADFSTFLCVSVASTGHQ